MVVLLPLQGAFAATISRNVPDEAPRANKNYKGMSAASAAPNPTGNTVIYGE
jgi:hypothetical protein